MRQTALGSILNPDGFPSVSMEMFGMADGSVLARGELFNVAENRETAVPMVIRDDPDALSVIGSLS